jgi:SAM-dependent methyltransferase
MRRKDNPPRPRCNINLIKGRRQVGSSTQPALDRGALRGLKAVLDRAGYTRDNVRAALKTDQHLTAQPGEVIVFERRVAGATPLEILVRLLLIGQAVSSEDAEAGLTVQGLADFERAGLLERTAHGVRSTVRLVPHGDIVVASDRGYYGEPETHGADVVSGVTSPAILLADLTIRKSVRGALDLGTGGGIQAMLLAKHCERVVAVDINPRALEYAQLNADLNGIDNIDLRRGSWFDPVEGERFDIITANPPYVMSPDSTFLYRDSGMKADSLCRQIVRDMPRFLEEDGFGHVLISWAMRTGEDWSEPLRRWVDGIPCDVWLLHYLTDDPLTQAGKWNQPLIAGGLDVYRAAIDRWMDYYHREGIEQIGFGAVVMRKRSQGSNWVRADSFHAGGGSSAGLMLRVFEAEDFLQTVGKDADLLEERFSLVPEHLLEQRLRSRDGEWRLEEATLTLTQGISFRGSLDFSTSQLLFQLDGRRTLREAVAGVSSELELSGDDAVSLADTAVAMTRRLYQLGILVRTTG